MQRQATPLASFNVLRTTSVDQAREAVGSSLAPHRLHAMEHRDFRALHNAAMLDRASLHYIDYGTEVDITVEELGFYLVQIPLGGTSTITNAGQTLTATARSALLTCAGSPARMRYSAGNRRLMLRLDRALFTERWQLTHELSLVERRPTSAVIDLTGGRGRSWRALLNLVYADIERDRGLVATPPVLASLETAIVDGLIGCLADLGSEAVSTTLHERTLRRALQLIDDHCTEPLSTTDIAEAIGVSVRALQEGFKDRLGTTPMAYLRHARLQRVRSLLVNGGVASITEAALECGFTHMGRFSGHYREAFGELPSQTLLGS